MPTIKTYSQLGQEGINDLAHKLEEILKTCSFTPILWVPEEATDEHMEYLRKATGHKVERMKKMTKPRRKP